MKSVIWSLVALLLLACQHSSLPLKSHSIQSQGYRLWQLSDLKETHVLHIYLEGDGQPWLGNGVIALDPGPRGLVSLPLMKQDLSARLYLGRPCYFQSYVKAQNCHPSLWTRARYSQQVVDVMVNALLAQTNLDAYDEWVLIGHSGGGALAYLMAQQLPKVNKVIAISSNLDVSAWVAHHQYAPLDQSLDPAKIDSPKPLALFYLAGGKDKNVPLELNQTFLNKVNAKIILREEYDHNCCWEKEWQKILDQI
ncbi:MAG: alpha/beta hydrolase [Cellvibrio sp.]|nr:alpha/beta hydrolase [Cellvibrio sp.]